MADIHGIPVESWIGGLSRPMPIPSRSGEVCRRPGYHSDPWMGRSQLSSDCVLRSRCIGRWVVDEGYEMVDFWNS